MKENLALAKEQLRRQLRAENKRPEAEWAEASKQIALRIKEHPVWRKSRSVLFYAALAGEPDLRGLCHEALKSGKIAGFPRYVEATDSYVAFQVAEPLQELVPGRFGVAEPHLSCAELPLNVLDLIFVPGIGFTFAGARLGRGKGYYDRLLSTISGIRCGVAFDWQIVAELPSEAHDIRLDCVVTPSQWRNITDQPVK